VTTVGCLAGDTLWYELGRWKGTALFGLLCRTLVPAGLLRAGARSWRWKSHRALAAVVKVDSGSRALGGAAGGAAGVPTVALPFLQYGGLGGVAGGAAGGRYLSMRTIDWLGLFAITARWAVGVALVVSAGLAAKSYWNGGNS